VVDSFSGAHMISIVVDDINQKITKRVTFYKTEIQYISFAFLWKGPFRMIYNSSDTKNFTAWKLDQNTGIWGCFADELDIGFDYETVLEEQTEKLSETFVDMNKERFEEKIQDSVSDKFFDMMSSHILHLYPLSQIYS
jgi:hypothetical protein